MKNTYSAALIALKKELNEKNVLTQTNSKPVNVNCYFHPGKSKDNKDCLTCQFNKSYLIQLKKQLADLGANEYDEFIPEYEEDIFNLKYSSHYQLESRDYKDFDEFNNYISNFRNESISYSCNYIENVRSHVNINEARVYDINEKINSLKLEVSKKQDISNTKKYLIILKEKLKEVLVDYDRSSESTMKPIDNDLDCNVHTEWPDKESPRMSEIFFSNMDICGNSR